MIEHEAPATISLSVLCDGLDTLEAINTVTYDYDLAATPLTVACWHSRLDFVEWLLQHGADPNLEAVYTIPLFVVIHSQERLFVDIAIVRALLDAGVDVNKTCADGLTALNECGRFPCTERYVRIAHMLVNRGARGVSSYKCEVPPWIYEYMDSRDNRRQSLCTLGAIVCTRVQTNDTRRLLMKNAK